MLFYNSTILPVHILMVCTYNTRAITSTTYGGRLKPWFANKMSEECTVVSSVIVEFQCLWISLLSWSTESNVYWSAIFINILYQSGHWQGIFSPQNCVFVESTKMDTNDYKWNQSKWSIIILIQSQLFWPSNIRNQLAWDTEIQQVRSSETQTNWLYEWKTK